MKYWYDEETDDYGTSSNEAEAAAFIALGYQEIDRIEWDTAVQRLK